MRSPSKQMPSQTLLVNVKLMYAPLFPASRDEDALIAAMDSMRHFASGQGNQLGAGDSSKNPVHDPPQMRGPWSILPTSRSWGILIGERPRLVMALCCVLTTGFGLMLLVKPLVLLTDPAKLWAQPGSSSAYDKAFFDAEYGPFWRTEMMIVRPLAKEQRAVSHRVLSALLDLQLAAEALRISCSSLPHESRGVPSFCEDGEEWGIEELCFQPVPGSGCLVQSALEFWQVNRSRFQATPGCEAGMPPESCDQGLAEFIDVCAREGASRRECWARNGVPLVEAGILFGYEGNATKPSEADAVVVTYLINNDEWAAPRAAAWEHQLKAMIDDDKGPLAGLKVSYSTEDSLTQELAKESASDVGTICVSYLVMFAYVAFALGRHPPSCPDPPPRRNRAVLGLCGVVIVGMSLVSAAGFCALLGVRATLIISEVEPDFSSCSKSRTCSAGPLLMETCLFEHISLHSGDLAITGDPLSDLGHRRRQYFHPGLVFRRDFPQRRYSKAVWGCPAPCCALHRMCSSSRISRLSSWISLWYARCRCLFPLCCCVGHFWSCSPAYAVCVAAVLGGGAPPEDGILIARADAWL